MYVYNIYKTKMIEHVAGRAEEEGPHMHIQIQFRRGKLTISICTQTCGVCDTPELWCGAAGLCACVRACAGAAESLHAYIHTGAGGSRRGPAEPCAGALALSLVLVLVQCFYNNGWRST